VALTRLLLALLWLPLSCVTAAAGDPGDEAQAAFDQGLKYDLGQGVPMDQAQAYHWYLQAASAGLPAAEFNVGVMNDSGTGTPKDPAAAATWYARAASHGYQRAEYNLAQLYRTGQGVPRNPDVAAAWLGSPPPARAIASGAADLLPVTLVAPGNGDGLAASQIRGQAIEFVWTAPAQPTPVRFFLEVVSIDNNTVRDMFAGYVDQTAWLVDLPDRPGAYEWRVCAVSRNDYSISPWNFFYQN